MLTDNEAAIVKGMIARGDKQHDVAARFGVNGGRIAEIKTGKTFESVRPASLSELPPAGSVLDSDLWFNVGGSNMVKALEANTRAVEKLAAKLEES